jgi:hypothetical protein
MCTLIQIEKKVLYVSLRGQIGEELAVGTGIKAIGSIEGFYITDLEDIYQKIYDELKKINKESEILEMLPFKITLLDGLKVPSDCKVFQQILRIK